MKLGLIGIGHIAKAIIAAVEYVPGLELAAAHDRDPARASHLPAGVAFYESLDRLLSRGDVDLFLVATPNVTHAEIACQVLQTERAVLLEKPGANTESELMDVVRLASTKAQFLAVAFHAAFALDVLWLRKRLESGELELPPLSSFSCGFYDPYFQNGAVVPAALGLGGSWFDSGINALSVIARFLDPACLSLREGRMTRIPTLPCSEIQGSADFAFEHPSGSLARGFIDTNWTLGINRKVTRLYFDGAGVEVALDHTAEAVTIMREGKIVACEHLANGRPRLVNHYIGLYEDVMRMFSEGKSNLHLAIPTHQLLYKAAG